MTKPKPSNLAFYKQSKTEWTFEDVYKLHVYMGYETKPLKDIDKSEYTPVNKHAKWIYNMDRDHYNLNSWTLQEPGMSARTHKFKPMAFEDIIPIKLKTFQIKDYK